MNNEMKIENVTSKLMNSWNVHWKNVSAKFDEFLKGLNKFVGKMFWVWDGNRRLQAWRLLINIIREKQLGTFPWIIYFVESIP